jgi:phenylpropionate dioxygenase-like ring-hydroxylating dioxygenase large terminal subunit
VIPVQPASTEEILERARWERARAAYPAGFPVLPPVPGGRYTDADFAALERERVFDRSWLFVAHADELPTPGDYLLLRQLPQPLFLVRGHDGEIRAFYNSCQHRGGPVVPDSSGNTGRRLVCGYHAWTYDLDGTLVGLPSDQDFQVDTACLGLPRVRCEQWGSLVFVNLDDGAPPLLDALGVLGRDLHDQIGGGEHVGAVHLVARRSIEVEGNWKLTVDANIETYHVNTVHRRSAALVLDQAATAISLLPGGHSRMLVESRDGKAFPLDLPAFPGASPLASSGIYSYHLFPNTSIVFGGTPALAFMISSWPLGTDRSLYDVHFVAATPADGPHADVLGMLVEANWRVLLEDLGNLPAIQRSLSTGGLAGMTLGYQERRIYHQHEELDRRIGAERVPSALRVEPKLADRIES